MSVNIACSVPKCVNPVIGQCTGYKKTCGRYYCHEHSSGTLCADCSNQKAADEHAEAVYHEYLALAEKVSREPISIPNFEFKDRNILAVSGCSIVLGAILLVGLILIGVIVNDFAEDVSQGLVSFYHLFIYGSLLMLGWPFLIVPLIWYSDRANWNDKERRKVISQRVIEIEREKQGFTVFWNAWVKQRRDEQAEKDRQALMGVLAVAGAIAVGVVAAGLSESEYDRTRRAARDEMNSR